nr:FAD:protein FMN transferase [bacterium]
MERVVKFLVFIALLAAGAIALLGVDCSDPGDIHRFDYQVMGTRAQGEIYVWDRTARHSPVHLVQATFDSVNTRLSSWSDDSEVGRFNAAPVGTTFTVSKWLSTCLRVGEELGKISGGAFDPSAGPLMHLWGFRGRQGRVPATAELDSARALLGGYEHDPFQRQLTKTRAGTQIDLGGVAKGFAVDRAVANLIEFGTSGALIDLGGNVFALGLPDDRDMWRVGIRDPQDPDEIFATFGMVNRAAATSGSYERFVEIDGHRYGHIMNPATGQPAEGLLSVTVVSRSATLTDALSTTLFVLGPERAQSLLHDHYPHVDAILTLP